MTSQTEPFVHVIQMGGSIDKDYPRSILGYAFEIGKPAAERILRRGKAGEGLSITTVAQKDSLDIDDRDRADLLKEIERTSCDKIIVTHGTDTIIKTGLFLSGKTKKSIVLTGSFLPERMKESDADFNLGLALGAVQYCPPGVYIALNGRVKRAEKVRRNDEGLFVGG